MPQKRKSAKPQSKPAALDPNAVMLAILTAILDPKGVQDALSYGRLPDSFSVACKLVDKIDNLLKGGKEKSRFQLFDLEVTEEPENTIPEAV